ncbi:MAG: PepSY-like domain-containing protein [Bacteroidales bacterium]|nr:PepSY-like domain-containing protein [Bacteroidales bacterium]
MKRFLILMACVLGTMSLAKADDRPVTVDQLPQAARTFLNVNFPDDKISFATKDDDLIRPDYQVVLASGVMVKFNNAGDLEEIESRGKEIPDGIIPIQIVEMVKGHYPDVMITGYEVGRRTYEVKLSNRIELKLDRNFNVIEIDD